MRQLLTIPASFCLLNAVSSADLINVPADQSTIQAAIVSASDDDEIIVAAGTYNEVVNFLGKAITLRSSDGPEATIINGTNLNSSVVKCWNGEGPQTVLEGFTITGGSGSPPTYGICGGGMYNIGSSPTVLNCVFLGNVVNDSGGGMFNLAGSNPMVRNCTFVANHAPGGSGGGMLNHDGSTPMIVNCAFINNVARDFGGGMYNHDASPAVKNSLFDGNTSGAGGGLGYWNSAPDVVNCTFGNNVAIGGGCGDCGGEGADLPRGGGVFDRGGSNPILTNCILWNNSDSGGTDESAQIHDTSGGVTMNYCCVQGWTGVLGGASNLGDDPLFVDPMNGDLHLSIGSSAIDAGDNSVVEADASDLDGEPRIHNGNVDMGAYEFNPCPTDLNFDGLVNASDLAQLLGAWGPCDDPSDCPADLHGDGDGIVQADDLAFILGHWGACE